MNVLTQIKLYLDDFKVHYDHNEEDSSFVINLEVDNTILALRLLYDEEAKRLMNFVEAPFTISREKYHPVLRQINKIHMMELSSSHLFINEETNHLMAQAVIEVVDKGIEQEAFLNFLMSPCWLIDNYFDEIMRLLVNKSIDQIALSVNQDQIPN